MNNDDKVKALHSELQRVVSSIEKSEHNFDKKRKRLSEQMVALEHAIKVLENRA